MRFQDRREAGRRLAEALHRRHRGGGVVYAVPRGGVVVGAEVARRLELGLEFVVTRKIVHPAEPLRAVAVATETDLVLSRPQVADVECEWLRQRVIDERREARRCRKLYAASRPPLAAAGKRVIIVDDGVITGLTLQAAVRVLQAQRPERLIIAVPFLAKNVADRLAQDVDDLVALDLVDDSVETMAARYDDFSPVPEEEVAALLGSGDASDGGGAP